MQYDWERKLLSAVRRMDAALPEGFHLVAAGIASTETGEGALINNPDWESDMSVIEADYRKDIMGDALAQYNQSVRDMNKEG